MSKFVYGNKCAATVVGDASGFSLYFISPPNSPELLYRQEEEVVVAGFSWDDRFLLADAAQSNNAFLRSLTHALSERSANVWMYRFR